MYWQISYIQISKYKLNGLKVLRLQGGTLTKYKEVILVELRYINNNSSKIIKYAKTVYNQKIKNIDIGYIKNTIDFKVLEEKLKEWNRANN